MGLILKLRAINCGCIFCFKHFDPYSGNNMLAGTGDIMLAEMMATGSERAGCWE